MAKNNTDMNFQCIIKNKHLCDDMLVNVTHLTQTIKDQYNKLLQSASQSTDIYLGIDSFNFQNKMLTMRLSDIQRQYNIVSNRLYCDYYKIYKAVKKYVETSCLDIPVINISVEVYKDLDMEKVYEFKQIIKLQNVIHQYIKNLSDILVVKNMSIQKFIDSDMQGYNVNYYIIEEHAHITMHTEKTRLFISYLESCNVYHNKYMINIFYQIQFLIQTIKKDVSNDNYTGKEPIEIPSTMIPYIISDVVV